MKIVVSNSYEGPIYEQIKNQIIHGILTDDIVPGDILPSMRSLAKELKVGVLTINRAYTELEREGYIENIQGKGCFVAEKSAKRIKQNLFEDARKKMDQAIHDAKKAGGSKEEIHALFLECLRRCDNE